ncbi:MAG TPA: Lrp/AsnC family transcriptional regulator [Usitatibacteraceae bacterium]
MPKNDPALDAFDRKILERYQHDTRVPAETIGLAVGLSTTAVQRRLKRLRETGIIAAEIAVLSPAPLDLPVTCVVGVDLEREGAADIDHFKSRMTACPEVQQCFYVTGATDFILVVLTKSLEDYEGFTRRMLLDDANVRSFTTHVVLDRVKVGLSVPLGNDIALQASN